MFLTGEGALLAVALAALVGGLLGAAALLRLALRRSDAGAAPRNVGRAGNVRRVTVPTGTAPKV
jgi:hypothetical protein